MSQLTLCKPVPQQHRELIADLTGKSFTSTSYWNWLAYCRDGYLDDSHYDWDASTIGVMPDNSLVTHWGIWGYLMRIGSASVRVAGVGAVATDGRFRQCGWMKRTALAGIANATAAGYDLSILFGIDDFYHKYGYVPAWPHQNYYIATARLPLTATTLRLYQFTLRHRRDLAQMYNHYHRHLTGTAVRPTYCRFAPRQCVGYCWRRQGRVAGYIIIDTRNNQFAHIESCGEVEEIFAVLAQLARRYGAKEIRFAELHYNSELARLLRRRHCRQESTYFQSGGAMVRTLNLASALAKLTEELAANLCRSPLAGWQGTLVIADPRTAVALEITAGQIQLREHGDSRHRICGGEEIARLLLGSDQPEEIVAAANFELQGDARQLLPILFPQRHPLLGRWDWF